MRDTGMPLVRRARTSLCLDIIPSVRRMASIIVAGTIW